VDLKKENTKSGEGREEVRRTAGTSQLQKGTSLDVHRLRHQQEGEPIGTSKLGKNETICYIRRREGNRASER